MTEVSSPMLSIRVGCARTWEAPLPLGPSRKASTRPCGLPRFPTTARRAASSATALRSNGEGNALLGY